MPSYKLPSLLLCSAALFAQTSVTTQHNDIGRTGQNVTESTLTPSNVNTAGFGKLFSIPVDGQVYAQPLYLPSVTINGAAHRVVFVATEHDSVYAFDASTGVQLWKVTMLDAAHGAASGATTDPESDTGCADISALNGGSEYGITGTPVIDPTTGTLYVVSKTYEGTYPVQRLHALDVTSGAEKLGGPVALAASVTGSGAGSSGSVLKFDPKWENQRTGLLLLNGNVYLGFGSHCDDSPWHGWILGYGAATLAQTAVFNATPNGSASGIWMGGAGLAADIQNAVGRIFPVTGNGTYDAKTPYGTNNMDYGDDILRLTQGGTGALTVADAFTPYNQSSYNSSDADVASGGALLLPDQAGANPHLLVQLGKSGSMYVVNRDNMGGFNSSSNTIVQTVTTTGGLWGMPAYWNGNVYVWPSSGKLSRYPVTSGTLTASPAEVSTQSQTAWYGSTPSISSNGAANGIVWSLDWSQTPGVLYAHNAANVSQLLWASSQNTTRDSVGTPVKFVVPTIADGNVFVGANNQFDIYGLLASPVPNFSLSDFPGALSVQPGTSATVQVTLSPVNSYAGTPTFTATGLPSGVTAAFSGPILNVYTVTLTADAAASLTTTGAAVTLTATDGTLTHSVPLTLSVSSAAPSTPVNLSSVFNIYAIYNNGATVANGGLDTASYAYSANLLGPTVTAENVYFTFGAPGTANGASNTTLPLVNGSFASLDFLGTGLNGNQANQSFVVTYTDGTTTTFTQSLSDWFTPQSYAGETISSTMAYRIAPGGTTDNRTFNLYAYSFALNSAKTVKSLTLPANRNVAVLAVTLAGPAAPSFALSTAPASVSVKQGASVGSTINIAPSGGFTGSVTLSASGLPTGVTATFGSNPTTGSSLLTLSASTSAAPGTSTVTITGVSGSLRITTAVSLTVQSSSLTSQTISFPTIGAHAAASTLALSASASSGLPVTFASTTNSVCTVSGATATLIAAGSCAITAAQAGNATYAAAPSLSQSFNVTLAAQSISFPAIAAQKVGTPLTLAATATSSLPVSYASSTTGLCTVSGNAATFLAAGTCSITASQTGNAAYSAATPVSQSFNVATASTGSFTLAASPTSVTVTPRTCFFIFCSGGTAVTDRITLTPANGFTGPIAFTISGLPTGVTGSFSPATVTTSGSTTLTLTPGSITTGHSTTLTVTGTSGSLSATTKITLNY